MIETYRNMKLMYTNNIRYAEEVLKRDGIAVSLYIDVLQGKAVFAEDNEEKTILEHLDSIDIQDVEEAIQITLTEATGILWVFSRRKK